MGDSFEPATHLTRPRGSLMEPTTDTELEIPKTLFKLLSEAAVVNSRTMVEEMIVRMAASLDREETNQKQQ